MPHSFGYRARTRKVFARPFRQHGQIAMTPYLTTFKVGDYVDIRVNGAVQKGMPHKIYHGKTGKVWNVTPRALGVEVHKRVRNVIHAKRFHIRIEHVKKSKCRDDFLNRLAANREIQKWNKQNPTQKKAYIKRIPALPRPAHTVRGKDVITVEPVAYEDVV